MTPMRRPLRRPLRFLPAVLAALLAASTAGSPPPARAAAGPAPLTPAQFSHRLSRDVYGYLPYWDIGSWTDAYLRYDLLTTISLFSFSYDPASGALNPPRAALIGPTARSIIANAHANGVRVELAFSFSQTASVNDGFFSNAAAQSTAISSTVALVQQLGADGVNLDVEALDNTYFALYGAFVKAMKAAIVAANPYGQVSVATNGNLSGAGLAGQALGNGADRDFIMGYDYRTGGANPVGSISPLISFNGGLNLTATLSAYATRGVPMGRVVLGLPYYGRIWPTVDNTLHSSQNTALVPPSGVTPCNWNGSPIFTPSQMGKVPAGSTFGYDTVEQSAWFATFDSAANTWCETYYDSPRSLSAKYALAVSSGLAGVGIWALGYDAGTADYWQAISANFSIVRLAGADRYGTAAAISAASFAPGAPVAFIATGQAFPDALAAGPAGAKLGGPVLLVTPTSIPAATAAELTRLKPTRIVVLGGTAAVSAAVETALGPFQTGGGVSRIAGADRYGTAAAVSAATFAPGVPIAYVATGLDFPDALGGADAGGVRGGPVLLVSKTSVPTATANELARLKPAVIAVLGGTSVVPDALVPALQQYTAAPIVRLAGGDRFGTAASISAATFAPGAPVAFLTTGLTYPDALAGSVVAARAGGPILLVTSSMLPGATTTELARLKPGRLVILGGTGVVPDSVVAAAQAVLLNSLSTY